MLEEYLAKVEELKKKREPFVTAIVVRREAPSSGKAGDKAVINKFGDMTGWVGGGCVKGILLKESDDAMKSGKPRLVRIGKHLKNTNQEDVREYKMTCQSEGMVEVFLEPVLPAPHLVVIGKSGIAKQLVRMAKAIGYRVTGVASDANLQTFEKVDELITQVKLDPVKTTPSTFIVVATQGEGDEQALTEAMKKESGYVGFVTSRKKMASVAQYLIDAGFNSQQVAGIHGPAGIDILAKRPEEVAISILAEMIQVKNTAGFFEEFAGFEQKDNTTIIAPKFYINPVCGVPVDINNPKHVLEYAGEKVYFCCDGCKVKFEAEPDKYMGPQKHEEKL